MGDSPFFHAHAHSHYSVLDGMPSVSEMVQRAAKNGQPGLALTDHGHMSGVIELYRECKQAGITPFPGEEFYLVQDVTDKDAKRYHIGMLALNYEGYKELVALSSLSQQRDRYHYRPRIDFVDLANFASENVAVLTGCYFGILIQKMIEQSELTGRSFESVTAQQVGAGIVRTLRNWFPHTYIEIQHHNNEHENDVGDDLIIRTLAQVSALTGQGMLVTQDAHYLMSHDKELHDLMKKIGYRGSDNSTFPGDSYHLARTNWMYSHYSDDIVLKDVWDKALVSSQELLDLNTLSMPAVDKYQYRIPNSVSSPRSWLTRISSSQLQKLNLSTKQYEVYEDRLLHELNIINQLGMANYFHLIYLGVEFCKTNGIMVNARGSANASLVCWLLGITQLDPIKYNLMFERFLSPDRKKPPDVDLDIEDTRRVDVAEFYKTQFDVTQIGTYNSLGENIFGKGSVLVQYLSWARDKYGDGFKAKFGHVDTIDDLDPDDAKRLHRLGAMGIKKSPGAHAAGFVLGSELTPLSDYIPTMLIPSSGNQVTQVTMEDVESLGYIKVDLLGQRTLTTVKRCLELLGRDPADGLDWIPDDNPLTMKQLREGRTDTGVFQFEGWTAARGCREMGIKRVKDAIAIMALYRPAVMQSGYLDTYLAHRRGQTTAIYPHPIFKKYLKETHGVAIYQEQVMAILREIGVEYEDLNEFLSALKMSNHKAPLAKAIFKKQEAIFIKLCLNQAMGRKQAQDCWDTIKGFGGYGFNRAHATAYGLLGYRTAYLKANHTLEFMAALLETTAGTPKEAKYVKEARRVGVRLKGADVNASGTVWRLDGTVIRKGLLSIKGVGAKAAEEVVANAPYDSIQEITEKCNRRLVTGGADWAKKNELKGVMDALRRGGALKTLGLGPFD